MSLEPGTRLGPFEVIAKLGEGGMGEVYRATDTRLRREVAVKVLPPAFTADEDRLARFEREAQLLAQLHHPHIASVFGLEEIGGVPALVMELVDGEDLSALVARGPLPLDEAVAIARQIAAALEAAHERGIVHRDLKPQNVKVAPDRTVKVLDFGLAKAMDPTSGATSTTDLGRSPTLMNSPTLTAHGTQIGVILGTAAYMAPEQARGAAVDKRADIWAFGVILFEMLTGRSLFAGETVSDTLAAVLKGEIDLGALPPVTPGAVGRLLRWCLERNPRDRLHDIADARPLLVEAGEASAAGEHAVSPPPSRWRRLAPWVVATAGLAMGGGALLLVLRAPPRSAAAPTTRVHLLPAGHGTIDGVPVLSPDGRSLVFVLVGEDGVSHLALSSFDSAATRVLPATENAQQPFWSPDGQWLAFFAAGHLSKLELASGLAQPLAPASDPRGGCWSDSGDLIFSPNSATGLFQINAAGGKPRRLTQVDPAGSEQSHRFPTCLPGAQAIVYAVLGNRRTSGLVWRSLRDGAVRALAPDLSRSAFDRRGYLLWVRQSTLVAQRFDATRGQLQGDPAPIGEKVGADGQRAGLAWFDTAGGVVALRSSVDRASELRWFDRSGRPLDAVTGPGAYHEPKLSPDGTKVGVAVATVDTPVGDIWVFPTAGRERGTRITFDSRATASTPAWVDGGRDVAFSLASGGRYGIGRRRADGTGRIDTLWEGPTQAFIDDTSERGPLAAIEMYDRDGGVDLWLMSLAGDRRPRRFGDAVEGSRAHGAFSPDGRLLAYTSDESGQPQIYVAEVDAPANRWQVTSDGGDLPMFRGDGKELYWIGLDRTLRAAPVQSLAPFAVGAAVPLFRLRMPFQSMTGNHTFYAPSRDGQRFLVRSWVGEESEPGILVTFNWRPPGEGR